MLDDLLKKAIKGIYLIPAAYWNSLFGVSAALISLGIGYTVFQQPDYSKDAVATAKQIDIDPAEVSPKSSVPMPPSLVTQNIFRSQRTNFVPPPPPQPQPKLEPVPDKKETLPEIKLRGTMIFGEKRVAIIDGIIKKYVKTERFETYGFSGAKYQEAKSKGLNYLLTPAGEEKLEGQSFFEGSEISGHIIERVFDDSIEVIEIGSGKRTLVYLDPADHKEAMARKLSGMEMFGKKPKRAERKPYKYGDISGVND
jgi:hypothetical protein